MDHIITIPPPGPLQRHLLILHYSYTLLRSFIDRTQVEEIGRVLLQYHDQIPEKGQVQGKDRPVPHIPPVQVDVPIVSSKSGGKGAKGVKGRRSTRATSTTTTTTATANYGTAAADEEGSFTYCDDTTSHPIAIPPMTLLSLLSFTDTTSTNVTTSTEATSSISGSYSSDNNTNNTSSNNNSYSGSRNSNSSNTSSSSSSVWAASYCINRLIATSEGWSSREIIKLIHNIQVRVLSMASDRYVVYTPYFCPYFRLNFTLISLTYKLLTRVYYMYSLNYPYLGIFTLIFVLFQT